MKNQKSNFIKVVIILFFTQILLGACNSPNESETSEYDEFLNTDILKSFPTEDLSSEEIAGLIFMREEEKLARDVYITLYNKWNAKVFNNISKSEQKHTDAIKILLQKYDLEDPMTNEEFGKFQNEDLQNLFNNLIEDGNNSLSNALKVGAAIEEIDIIDLQKQIELTDNQDIAFVYENLLRGSRNHLRAFVRNISMQGETYIPQYLSQETFESIINTPQEKGRGRKRK